jgi:hypothetical protein
VTGKAVDYRRTDFFADLDLAARLDTDFFAAVLDTAFLALVFLAEVFLAAVFFVVFFKTPALAVSAPTALPTGILLTCFATDVAAATAFVGTAGLPCPTRLPITAPATPPTIAPAGPATMLPATAPVTAPAACLVSGTFGLEFDSFAMTAVYMRSACCAVSRGPSAQGRDGLSRIGRRDRPAAAARPFVLGR